MSDTCAPVDGSSKPLEGRESAPRRVRFSCSTEGLTGASEKAPGSNRANPHQHPHDRATKNSIRLPKRSAEEIEADRNLVGVYFVRAANGLIKIGYTRNGAVVRLQQHRAASPVPLELLFVVRCERVLESALHRFLQSSHSHGEWFLPTREVLAFVRMGLSLDSPDERREAFCAAIPTDRHLWRLGNVAIRGRSKGSAITPRDTAQVGGGK